MLFFREHDNSGIIVLSLGGLQTSQGKILSISKDFWMAHMTWVGDNLLLCSCQGLHSSEISPVASPRRHPLSTGSGASSVPAWTRPWSWASLILSLTHGVDGLDLIYLPQTCSKVMIPAALTGSDPDLQISFQLDLGFASSPQTCLIVWTLGWISAAVYGPALLPHWDIQDPALVTLPLAPYSLGESSCPCCFLTVMEKFLSYQNNIANQNQIPVFTLQ